MEFLVSSRTSGVENGEQLFQCSPLQTEEELIPPPTPPSLLLEERTFVSSSLLWKKRRKDFFRDFPPLFPPQEESLLLSSLLYPLPREGAPSLLWIPPFFSFSPFGKDPSLQQPFEMMKRPFLTVVLRVIYTCTYVYMESIIPSSSKLCFSLNRHESTNSTWWIHK